MTCKYCNGNEYYFVLSTGKIERFGLYCKKCNRFQKWISKVDEHKIPIDLVYDKVGQKKDLTLFN